MASITFDANIFPGHPYGRPEDGFLETIQAITPHHLQDFHNLHYGPGGMVIVIVGGITSQQAVEIAQKELGSWVNPNQPVSLNLPSVHLPKKNIRLHVPIRGKAQTDLVMGSIGPKRSSPEYLAASLGNNILGQFGMMGRIGDVVREQAGLAYHASTSLNAWIAGGSWEVSAGVNPANLERAIDLIRLELERFVNEPVSPLELEDSQAHFVGRLPLSLESNAGVTGALLNLERFNLGLDYYRRYADLIWSITPAQILKTAHRYINPDKLVIVSAGSEPEA